MKLRQTGQRGHVAQTLAPTEIERLKLRQAGQHGHVAQTLAPTEIERLQLRQASQHGHVTQFRLERLQEFALPRQQLILETRAVLSKRQHAQ